MWLCTMTSLLKYSVTVKFSIVLSRASAHGCSQLKCQKLKEGGYTEKVLKWFNYPWTRAHPRCKVSCQGVQTESTSIVTSSVLWGQPDNGESCIVLQSGPTRSLVAKFSHRSVIACSTRILCCRSQERGHGRMPDIVVPKAHPNNRRYVSSADLPLDSLCKNLVWWAVTRRTSKITKLSKLGGGCLSGAIR